MTYADMFSKVKGLFMESDVSDISEHLAFQFNITGEAEGIFYAEVKDGVLAVEPYEYFDRDAIFICSAQTEIYRCALQAPLRWQAALRSFLP